MPSCGLYHGTVVTTSKEDMINCELTPSYLYVRANMTVYAGPFTF
jgi:hypothetical protein